MFHDQDLPSLNIPEIIDAGHLIQQIEYISSLRTLPKDWIRIKHSFFGFFPKILKPILTLIEVFLLLFSTIILVFLLDPLSFHLIEQTNIFKVVDNVFANIVFSLLDQLHAAWIIFAMLIDAKGQFFFLFSWLDLLSPHLLFFTPYFLIVFDVPSNLGQYGLILPLHSPIYPIFYDLIQHKLGWESPLNQVVEELQESFQLSFVNMVFLVLVGIAWTLKRSYLIEDELLCLFNHSLQAGCIFVLQFHNEIVMQFEDEQRAGISVVLISLQSCFNFLQQLRFHRFCQSLIDPSWQRVCVESMLKHVLFEVFVFSKQIWLYLA